MLQIVFKKQLSRKQWISLVLLTLGCMMKHVNLDFGSGPLFSNFHLNINALFIFIQVRFNAAFDVKLNGNLLYSKFIFNL